jgi:hypothetical protein
MTRFVTLAGSKIIASRVFDQASFQEVAQYTKEFKNWIRDNSDQINKFHEEISVQHQTNIITLEFKKEEDALLFIIQFKSS